MVQPLTGGIRKKAIYIDDCKLANVMILCPSSVWATGLTPGKGINSDLMCQEYAEIQLHQLFKERAMGSSFNSIPYLLEIKAGFS